jgi:hypothetical protein
VYPEHRVTAAVVRPTLVIPFPRTAADDSPPEMPSLRSGQVSRAVAYQRVLGLALEDSCAAERARLLDGLSRATRSAWRLYGGRRYRAAVVRLRGAPPAL